jgi:hypothetical protein
VYGRRQHQRVGLQHGLEVGTQPVFEGTDIGLCAQVRTSTAGDKVQTAQVHEGVPVAALIQERLNQTVPIPTFDRTPANSDNGYLLAPLVDLHPALILDHR